MIKMRRRAAWLNIVALLMLVVANLPASVIASMCHPVKCEMVCCQGGEQAAQEAAQTSHCHQEVVQAKASDHCKSPESNTPSVSAKSDDHCKCQISSGTPAEPKPIALNSATNPTLQVVYAVLPPATPVLVVVEAFQVRAGIYATDSGPPVSRPHYVRLGRAPPVLLA